MIARLCQHYNAVLRQILSLRIVPCNISLNGVDEISFSLSKLECPPQEVNTREIRLHLQIAKRQSLKTRKFIFEVTFSR